MSAFVSPGVGESERLKTSPLFCASSIAEGTRSDSVKMSLKCRLCVGLVFNSRDNRPHLLERRDSNRGESSRSRNQTSIRLFATRIARGFPHII